VRPARRSVGVSGRFSLGVFALIGAVAACGKSAPPAPDAPRARSENSPLAQAPQPRDYDAPRRPTPPGAIDPPRLPEDPVAAKRAEAQWREHLDREEEERQMLFDRPRLKQHRAVVRMLETIRSRYDRAKTEPAVAKVRGDASRQLDEVRKRVSELDPWGVNSRLLPDYAALENTLANEYAGAKLAMLAGDATQLASVRANVDKHLHVIDEWLEEAAESEHEE
jgi:hypothetical protein